MRKWMEPIPCLENDPPVIQAPGFKYQEEDDYQPKYDSPEVIAEKRTKNGNRGDTGSKDRRELQK